MAPVTQAMGGILLEDLRVVAEELRDFEADEEYQRQDEGEEGEVAGAGALL